MRRTLTALLMLLMLTPAMVCVMTLCPEPAQAAAEVPPCHEGATPARDDAPRVPMLAGDCLLNDLGTATAPDLPEPPAVFLVLMFMVPAMLAFIPLPAAYRLAARAPPRPRGRASFHRLLITRRILQ